MDIVSQFKKGWYTSEFWVGLVTMLAPLIVGLTGYQLDVQGVVTVIGGVFSGVTYIASRTWLKRARVNALATAAVAAPAALPTSDDPMDDVLPDEGQSPATAIVPDPATPAAGGE